MAHQKTPTCLLLTPEGAFHSFGYTARDYYHDLDPEEARDWLYFEKFKMKIHSATVRHAPVGGPIQPGKRGQEGKGRGSSRGSRGKGGRGGEAERAGLEVGPGLDEGRG